jgi:hypothetical protein
MDHILRTGHEGEAEEGSSTSGYMIQDDDELDRTREQLDNSRIRPSLSALP